MQWYPERKGAMESTDKRRCMPHWQMAGYKFRGSAVSQTLRAPCERRASRSPSLWSEQRRGMEGKREPWSREKEGGEKRETEEETRGESLRSPVALTRLFPARDLGATAPPLGHKPQLSGKLVWSTPGTTPTHWGILRHTNKHLHKKHPGCSTHVQKIESNIHTACSGI